MPTMLQKLLKPDSLEKILKSPRFWGFFFVLLLASCDSSEKVPNLSLTKPERFTYSPPVELILALRNIGGFEDSHSVPGHEKLGHDHATAESWTNPKAEEELRKALKKYKELNPTFVYVLGSCFIPDHTRHYATAEGEIKHFTLGYSPDGIIKEGFVGLDKNQDTNWVLAFKDRVLLVTIDLQNRVKIKEKRLSP